MADYRKVPFMNRSTGIATLAPTGDAFMDGLSGTENLRSPQTNVIQQMLESDFPAEPFLFGYNPVDVGSGLAGPRGKGEVKTAIVRPRPGAAPGWPGFFAWVASVSPDMYDYLRVSLPNFVEDRQSFRSGAPALGAIDFSWPTPDVQIPSLSSTEGQTDSTPLPTTTATSQIIDTVKQAAAAFLPLITQQKLLQINVDRARQGLPPIDTASYESASQGINVGVNRSTQQTLLMLAAGIGAVYLLSQVIGKR